MKSKSLIFWILLGLLSLYPLTTNFVIEPYYRAKYHRNYATLPPPKVDDSTFQITEQDVRRTGWPHPNKIAFTFGKHAITIYDEFGVKPETCTERVEKHGDILIYLDDERIEPRADFLKIIPIRTCSSIREGDEYDFNRYYGILQLGILVDKQTTERYFYISTLHHLREKVGAFVIGYRIWLISERGDLSKDEFAFPQRREKIYRLPCVSAMGGTFSGFFIDSYEYPNLIYPIIFPFITLALGIGMIARAYFKSRRR